MTQNTPVPVSLDGPGFLSIEQIVPDLIPISKATFYRCVQSGVYPSSVQVSANRKAWRKSDIKSLIDKLGGCDENF
jgi:prophage regulatory protein